MELCTQLEQLAPENRQCVENIRLGKAPAKSSTKAIMFADILKRAALEVPETYDFWKGRAAFPLRLYGNDRYGDCTIASQAIAMTRAERLETRQTPKIPDDNVVKAYFDMTARLYKDSPDYAYYNGDTGAYETDALSNWRNADYTFRDYRGRPLTIDAYTRINHLDHEAIKRALYITNAKGIKLCFNMPIAWSNRAVWDAPPEGTNAVGEWAVGSWGGHSVYAFSKYDRTGFWIQTWDYPPIQVTWRGAALYMDEAHWFIDSVDSWRKTRAANVINFPKLISRVNEVSDIKIAA